MGGEGDLKKSRNHSRGSEGGQKARLFPHPIVGATVAFASDKGLDERERSRSSDSEVFLFRRSSHPKGQ
jgi:hypothetical protein